MYASNERYTIAVDGGDMTTITLIPRVDVQRLLLFACKGMIPICCYINLVWNVRETVMDEPNARVAMVGFVKTPSHAGVSRGTPRHVACGASESPRNRVVRPVHHRMRMHRDLQIPMWCLPKPGDQERKGK